MEPTLKRLGASDFNPDKYVKELSQKCVGGQELQRIRTKIQFLSDETNVAIKKNVYQNYMQFIDTAKEISHLEGEMYQLSHMLTEQRSLLGELVSTSILENETNKATLPAEGSGDANVETSETTEEEKKADSEEEMKRRKLTAILEKVEGCMRLFEPPGRFLLHEGDLLELDPSEHTALQRIHAYLFNDCLMLTTWVPNRRGPIRYKFQTTYEAGNLAVVNVRDLGNVKLAFKLLTFPDSRIFQCSSNASKKDWLEKFEQVKNLRRSQEQIKRDGTSIERSPSRSVSIESPVGNPYMIDQDQSLFEIPEWLSDVAEELDVLLAQRHHEEALQLLERANTYISEHIQSEYHNDNKIIDIKSKMESRKKSLIDALFKELEVSPEKSLQGGLRSTRRPVKLLKQLNKSTQACELFLQLCSSILKIRCKRVKREGSTSMYTRNLAAVVFTNISDMAEEFLRAFPKSPPCSSAFVVWVSNEVAIFTSHLIKQLFHATITISVLAECIIAVHMEAQKLWKHGVDIVYQISGSVRTPLCRALRDCRDKLVDSARLRALEDKWTPTNIGSAQKLTKLLNTHNELGLDLTPYVTGDSWLGLSNNTIYFIKMYLTLLDDCLKLSSPELQFTLDETLFDVFQAQLKQVEASLNIEKQPETKQFISKNALFLMDVFLPLVENKYKGKVGIQCNMLARLHEEFCTLRRKPPAISKPITKYTTTEYL